MSRRKSIILPDDLDDKIETERKKLVGPPSYNSYIIHLLKKALK